MNKICLFSDLHIGLKDTNGELSKKFYQMNLEIADWIVEECTQRGVTKIIFAGDFFHSRKRILPESIKNGDAFIDRITDNDIEIIMITGNHDCLYEENSRVNSLAGFRNRKGVTLCDNKFKIAKIGQTSIGLAPWGTTVSDMKSCDILIGHFDIQGFMMQKNTYADKGFTTKDLMKISKNVISGHYHIPQQKTYKASGGKFTYLGSPYQHNFGYVDIDHYIWFMDTNTGELEKVLNTISPVHKYITDVKGYRENINDKDFFKVRVNRDSLSFEEQKEFSEITSPTVDIYFEDNFTALKPEEGDEESGDVLLMEDCIKAFADLNFEDIADKVIEISLEIIKND
jgi:DNA repair exonuclease SbcCD nuclease subunit